MKTTRRIRISILLVMVVPCSAFLFGGSLTSLADESSKRVQPPEWSRDVLDAFFDDAREELVGMRPTASDRAPRELVATSDKAGEEEAEFKWSALVDADTLTAEVKRLTNQLATGLKSSATFQGGGNLECRRDFGMLAVLFGVIADFDSEVRWQRSAGEMRKRCLQASMNCKVASAENLTNAEATHALLGELLRGQGVDSEPAPQQELATQLADRTLLMQYMELALKEQLAPALTSAREFRKRTQQAAEQAQLLAVLAEVVQIKDYKYANDDEFLAEARRLREASSELAHAASDKNYEAARSASGRVGQSCSRCHEGYRG